MNKLIDRLKVVFVVIFLVGAAVSWAYQLMWVIPRRECHARGNWWSDRHRACAVPIDITQITGRPKGAPPAAVPAAAPSTRP